MSFDPIRPQKKLIPTKINVPIAIDGRLDEPVWRTIPALDDFVEINPTQGARPSQRTVVKVAYTETFLYVATECYDESGVRSLRVPDFRRDFNNFDHDHVAIVIDGFHDARNAMAFLFNPFGVQRDVLCFDDRFFDVEWDALWRVRTQRTDTAWLAEVAIPWKTLRYPANEQTFQTWGINFCRQRRSTNEYYSWSPFPRAYSLTRMAYEGLLDSLQVPASRTNLRVQPYSLLNVRKEHGKPGQHATFKAGGEAKWAMSPSQVLDLTFNTDFAQADVDQQINNVQRFSYFFPERRQFFLENAGLLRPGLNVNPDGNKGTQMVIQPFFSRRIGLDDNGQAIPLQVGTRYIRRGDESNLGLMALRQGSGDSLAPTHFFIGRYTHNLRRSNTLGVLLTARVPENGPDSRLPAYSNWSGSVDGFFRLSQQLEMNGMLSGTSNQGKAGSGMAGYAQVYYRSDQLVAWWNQSFVTAGYDPEVGFVNRRNAVVSSPGFYLQLRERKWLPRFARTFAPGVKTDFVQTATTGRLEEVNIAAYPVWFNFHNGGFAGFAYKYQYQRLQQDFEPLNTTIVKGTYQFHQLHLFLASDPSRKWSTNFEWMTGGFYDGHLNYGLLKTRFSPVPHLALDGSLESYFLRSVGEQRSSGEYYLYSVQARLSFSPRLQTFFLFQRNTTDRTDGFNARFSWEYRPLSYVFLVFNSRSFLEKELRDTASGGIIKLSYLKQF